MLVRVKKIPYHRFLPAASVPRKRVCAHPDVLLPVIGQSEDQFTGQRSSANRIHDLCVYVCVDIMVSGSEP